MCSSLLMYCLAEAVAEPVAEPVPEPVADKTQPDPAEPLPDFKVDLSLSSYVPPNVPSSLVLVLGGIPASLLSLCLQLSLLEDAMLELSKFQGEMRVKEASVGSLPIDIWDSSSLEVLKGEYSCHFLLCCWCSVAGAVLSRSALVR